jgi:hypothetical protein
MRYDPSKYEDVATRLQRIHSSNSNLRVITEIAWHDDEFNKVAFKASLMEGDTVLATGFAMDWKAKDRGATTTNWVEVAETSAIGRCIANSKHQDKGAERPSKQEMEIAASRQAEVKDNGTPKPSAKPARPLSASTGEAAQLTKVVGVNEAAVNRFLLERSQIKEGQTYRDVASSYAKSMVEYPAKFLALALSSDSKK